MGDVIKIVGSSAHTADEREKNDYYATDPQALIDFLDQFEKDGESLHVTVWEPACGEGNLSKVLDKRNHSLLSTDLIERGYGHQFNFLQAQTPLCWYGDILTNPPYKLSEKFVRTALNVVQDKSKVIMLFKLQFVESSKRFGLFKAFPPKFIYVHSRRIKIWKNNEDTGSGNALCYAWFVWEKGFKGDTTLRWIP